MQTICLFSTATNTQTNMREKITFKAEKYIIYESCSPREVSPLPNNDKRILHQIRMNMARQNYRKK